MSGGDQFASAWVVHQIVVSIGWVAYQDALKVSVSLLAPLMVRDVDVCQTSKDSEMVVVKEVAVCKRAWYTVDAIVVSPVDDVTFC